MALFNNAVRIPAPTERVTQAIRQTLAPDQVLRVVRANTILIAAGPEFSYVYVLRQEADNQTLLRLIVDGTPAIQKAFADPNILDALRRLVKTVESNDAITQAATDHLRKITEAFLQATRPPSSLESALESVLPASSRSASRADPRSADPSPNNPRIVGAEWRDKPWNPAWLWAFTFLFSSIVSGLALGWNWRRLGKPTWVQPTVYMAIALPILSIFTVLTFVSSPLENLPMMVIILGAFGVNVGFVALIAYLQNGAYQAWYTGGYSALDHYKYDLHSMLIRLGRYALIIVVLGVAIYFVTRPGPQTYDGPGYKITYPGTWNRLSSLDDELCMFAHCTLILSGDHDKNSSLKWALEVITYPQDTLVSVEQAADSFEKTGGRYSHEVLDKSDYLIIHGMKAVRRYVYLPNDTNYTPNPVLKNMTYDEEIFILQAHTIYHLNAWGINKDYFGQRRSDFDQIISDFVVYPGK